MIIEEFTKRSIISNAVFPSSAHSGYRYLNRSINSVKKGGRKKNYFKKGRGRKKNYFKKRRGKKTYFKKRGRGRKIIF